MLSAGGAGDEGGGDVRGVAVEGLAATVLAHRRAGVGVNGRFLHITQRYISVQRRGDEGVTQGVRSDPLADLGAAGNASHDPPRRVPVESPPVVVDEDRSLESFTDGQIDRPGPIPHLPPNGKVVTFRPGDAIAEDVASGAPLITDVEFGHGHKLYAVSQGVWTLPNIPENEGMPASQNTGRLLRVNADGTFTSVVGPLDQPTSLEFIGKTAFVVTLTGKLLRIDNVRSH